jgi:hypothetical protein
MNIAIKKIDNDTAPFGVGVMTNNIMIVSTIASIATLSNFCLEWKIDNPYYLSRSDK